MTDQIKAKDPTMGLLQEKLREVMNNLADHMLDDGCSSFEDYRHQTGTIHGLALAERELLDLDDKLYKDA